MVMLTTIKDTLKSRSATQLNEHSSQFPLRSHSKGRWPQSHLLEINREKINILKNTFLFNMKWNIKSKQTLKNDDVAKYD